MASQPAVLSATIVDKWGIEASAPFYALVDDSKTVAAMLAEADAFWSALDLCTDGYIRRVRLELVPAIPGGVKTAAVATGATVEQTGLLGFSATGTSKRYSGTIPAISDGATVLSADRIVLNTVDPVGALIFILTTVGTVLKWANEHNQQITAFVDALVSFRKKRKQLQRSGFEV